MANNDWARTLERLLTEAGGKSAPKRGQQALGDLNLNLSSQSSADIRMLTEASSPATGSADQGPQGVLDGARDSSGRGAAGETGQLIRQLAELTSAARIQAENTETNTQAVIENSLAQVEGSNGSKAGAIGKSVLSVLGQGLGLVRLLGGLFGGNQQESPPALPSYVAPPPVNLEAGYTQASQSSFQEIRYAQDGLPRPVRSTALPASPQVTVQVQAIDSQSFMDHSAEIAQAVKQALLTSHSLNDVVGEM